MKTKPTTLRSWETLSIENEEKKWKTSPPKRRAAPTRADIAFTSTSHPQSASSGQAIGQPQKRQSAPSHLIHAPRLESESLQFIDGGAAPRHLKGGDVIGGSAPHHLEGGDVLVGSAPHHLKGGDVIGGAALHQLHVSKIQEANAGYVQQESVTIDVVQPSSSETNEGENRLKRDLLRAAYTGDWRSAKPILDKNPEFIRCRITKEKDTVLHNAVAAKRTTFVTELLKLMTMGDLEIESIYKFTALHVAAETGVVRMAMEIVEKNDKLPLMNDVRGVKPLFIAADLGHRNMVSYLLSVTAFERLTTDERFALLLATIYNDLYDIALEIAEKILDPKSAPAGNTGNDINGWWTALEELARKRSTNGYESQQSFWKGCSNSWFKGIYTKASTQSTSAHKLVEELLRNVDCELSSNLALTSLFEAAKVGNVEFIIILARTYPDLIWQVDEKNQSLFHIAILYRQRSVFSLIYEIGNNMESLASNIDEESKENMLHLVGRLPPPDRLNIVSGAALQMQQELLWFKEIENIVPQSYVNQKNSKKKTPNEIFTAAHKGLRTNGEK